MRKGKEAVFTFWALAIWLRLILGVGVLAVARIRVPKMVENGVRSVLACTGSLCICRTSMLWLCPRNRNHFTPISGQGGAQNIAKQIIYERNFHFPLFSCTLKNELLDR
jgi:hypothetical protein